MLCFKKKSDMVLSLFGFHFANIKIAIKIFFRICLLYLFPSYNFSVFQCTYLWCMSRPASNICCVWDKNTNEGPQTSQLL